MTVAAAVLAAGRGSRVESDAPKPLLRLRDRPLVEWALAPALTSGCSPVVLVVGHLGGAVADATAHIRGITTARALEWEDGIAGSLHAALHAVDGIVEVTAVCVGLADQPLVGADSYRRLVHAHRSGAQLAVATYAGVRGNPVLLGREIWPEALALHGDTGARALMPAHDVVEVDCTGTGDPSDIDTLGDLRAVERALEEESGSG